ncbi:MAG: hypothetical protein IIW54_00135, partial [Lachnospiraceae bacterium]|nr:hypothetical protein [Lachnospiraceae bacterium]
MSRMLTVENLNVWYHKMSAIKKNSKKNKTNIVKTVDRNAPHKYIVKEFSMYIDTGEIVGLVGPSGCGKT